MDNNYLNSLNNQQKTAVSHFEGPLLILAGAGSGKTKVLTTRVANLIFNKKCFGQQILCVTFTNKAANEMRERVLKLINNKSNAVPWLGTFHSLSNKILRKHAEAVGLKPNFTIIDTLDQIKLIRNILEAENIDIKQNSPKQILYNIDRWKNLGLVPSNVTLNKSEVEKAISLKIYKIYQEKLKMMNCVDFGDLILHCVTIFQKFDKIRKFYQNNFKYILVDEFQDTNFIQNLWLQLLVNDNKNICVVGDDDQSIYSWRGAEIKNILNFEKNFKNTKIIKLEQNYRSTKNILSAASSLISNNDSRHPKKLWSEFSEGDKVQIQSFSDGLQEAIFISDQIEKTLIKNIKLNNIAILVRAAFQTREFEERFIRIGLPYRIIGGLKFYERAEIKDAVSYLRLIKHTNDDLAFERIINQPKRSIGESSVKKIHEVARKERLSLFEASLHMIDNKIFKPKTEINVNNFVQNILTWKKISSEIDHVSLLEKILDESGYTQMLINERSPEAESRLENLKELRSSMKVYDNLDEFLENISLQTSLDEEWDGDKINIMTVHAAKGLEFEVVFLPGLEEGLFPHQKSIDDNGHAAVEEERRLAYVAMTRAKKNLFMLFANNRKFFGNKNIDDWMPSMPSRFIDEIDKEFIEITDNVINENNDFEFSQEIQVSSSKNSPGWLRMKKNIENKERVKSIAFSENFTNFTVGEGVKHEGFGEGKIIHIEGNKLLINFKKYGEKKVIDKFVMKLSAD